MPVTCLEINMCQFVYVPVFAYYQNTPSMDLTACIIQDSLCAAISFMLHSK